MRSYIIRGLLIAALLIAAAAGAKAEVKIINSDCPVFVTNHIVGEQVLQYPAGTYSLLGVVGGLAADSFPAQISFKTLTTYSSTARYQPALSSIVLSDGTGKNNLTRFEFASRFDRPGGIFTQIIEWKAVFPQEGFYAFTAFVDGKVVGYYPFYVGQR